jgi:hypothetical protein
VPQIGGCQRILSYLRVASPSLRDAKLSIHKPLSTISCDPTLTRLEEAQVNLSAPLDTSAEVRNNFSPPQDDSCVHVVICVDGVGGGHIFYPLADKFF